MSHSRERKSDTNIFYSVCHDWLAYVFILWCSEQSPQVPEYVYAAVEAGLLSPPPDEEGFREIYTFIVTSPITLLVSGLALGLQSDLVTDMCIVLSSILSAFLLCVFWWSAWLWTSQTGKVSSARRSLRCWQSRERRSFWSRKRTTRTSFTPSFRLRWQKISSESNHGRTW